MSQRTVIDPFVFAQSAALLQADLPVNQLSRVLDQLADSTGHLSYTAQGQLSACNMSPQRPQVLIKVDGVLQLVCQRCLEALEYPVEIRSLLEFVANEADLTEEELDNEVKDFLPLTSELDLLALIEDEIILDLPPAPRHDDCALPAAEQKLGKLLPFSVLETFKAK